MDIKYMERCNKTFLDFMNGLKRIHTYSYCVYCRMWRLSFRKKQPVFNKSASTTICLSHAKYKDSWAHYFSLQDRFMILLCAGWNNGRVTCLSNLGSRIKEIKLWCHVHSTLRNFWISLPS